MWYLFQGLIVFAVVASNIHWQWTPNGYLAAGLGAGIAFLVTAIVNDLRTMRLERRARRGARKKQID
jgi:uncharacterized membrane protein